MSGNFREIVKDERPQYLQRAIGKIRFCESVL
jgi:hypothetical protein